MVINISMKLKANFINTLYHKKLICERISVTSGVGIRIFYLLDPECVQCNK